LESKIYPYPTNQGFKWNSPYGKFTFNKHNLTMSWWAGCGASMTQLFQPVSKNHHLAPVKPKVWF